MFAGNLDSVVPVTIIDDELISLLLNDLNSVSPTPLYS